MGELLTSCLAVVFSDFNLSGWSVWSWWIIAAFFLLGIYGKVVWMVIATVILGSGHIGIHMQHSKELKISG